MKALRPFLLVALLLALVPAAGAAPAEAAPEASLWGEFVDAVVHILESVVESVLPDPEATAPHIDQSIPNTEDDSTLEAYPLAEPVG